MGHRPHVAGTSHGLRPDLTGFAEKGLSSPVAARLEGNDAFDADPHMTLAFETRMG